MRHVTRRSGGRWHRRSAFTLVELLIVIVIISVLMALLLPAIGGVRRSMRQKEVKAEIRRIEASLAAFKARYGHHPPSAVVIPRPGTAWDSTSRRRIRAIWPQFNFALSGGMAPGYFATGKNHIVLTGAECLLFFLGGIPQGAAGGPPGANERPVFTGFSKNAALPFQAAGENRDGPFLEIDSGRLSNVDGDNFAEYLDTLPDQQVPYLYVSSDSGRGYPTQVPDVIDDYDVFNNDDATNWADRGRGNLADVYRQGGTRQAWKKETFQIISPGEDGIYSEERSQLSGLGDFYGIGYYSDGENMPVSEADNITNFNEGALLGK